MSLSKAFGFIGGINDCVTFFNWARSTLLSWGTRSDGTKEQKPDNDVVQQLQSDLRCLEDTLPAMYDLIDRAEWRSHKDCVAKLLPKFKDAVYDAEDLLDEFRWYDMKVRVEGDAVEQSPIVEFLSSIIHCGFNKVVDTHKRLSYLSSQLKNMGLHEATQRFDKSLRPVTTRLCTEPKIFGRKEELEDVIRFLGVPTNTNRSSKRKRTSNAANNEPRIPISVLPIVGIGGVGKTTLAQEITTLPRVKSHFDNNIIWICVSDDFDEERFTRVLIKSLSGKESLENNLDDLQQNLVKEVGKKKFLLILDDIWPDPSKKDEHRWRKFCAPLRNVLQGSMLLVTTRFAEVAEIVGTMEPFTLEGLKDEVFWEFFKLCVFGQENSHFVPQLEQIGRSILVKLKGTPLAAKTIGRLLRKSLDVAHWNDILNNELWQIEQKQTDILPALRLSYIYLPFHLKRCFSFCAVYPKDYNFDRAALSEIWVAEGYVEPQGDIPLQRIGDQYFEDLLNLSFFQKLRGKYVIHDLMHDMAQLVSKDECFNIKHTGDIGKIPPNVRHLLILPSCDLKSYDILILGKHTKLRTLLCYKSLKSQSTVSRCFDELRSLRVICCASLRELPKTIGNLKHLRYLEISRQCIFKDLPPSFCSLYNLQFLYARKCEFRRLPKDIGKLINLQKFESNILKIDVDASEHGDQTRFITNFNPGIDELVIRSVGQISTRHAAEMGLSKKEYINNLKLQWGSSFPEHNQIEVFQALHPPTSIKSVHLDGCPCQSLPSWLSFPGASVVTADDDNSRVPTIFSSLTELSIAWCGNLSSLEQFLQPACVPAIKKIKVTGCRSLKSVPIDSASLEEFRLYTCPNVTITCLLVPSLKALELYDFGNLGDNIECSSLTTLDLARSHHLSSIKLQKWSLPVLRDLTIRNCPSLLYIGESEHISTELCLGLARSRKFPLLRQLTIACCDKLETLDDLLTHEYLPAIESIEIEFCGSLSLPTERFGSFPFLRDLTISMCTRLNWQGGMVLPSSLQKLMLRKCGNLSACFPSCLENLTSLQSLKMESCEGIVSVPRDLWRSNLISLQYLMIQSCPDLESIGGPKAIEHINTVYIELCPKLKEVYRRTGY